MIKLRPLIIIALHYTYLTIQENNAKIDLTSKPALLQTLNTIPTWGWNTHFRKRGRVADEKLSGLQYVLLS